MGTPVSRSPSPFPFEFIDKPQCHFCTGIHDQPLLSCPKGCFLCNHCCDFYCPLCFTRMESFDHLNLNELSIDMLNTPKTRFTKTLTSAYYTLELIFFGGVLMKITIQSSRRNFRLQLKYGPNTTLLHLYRDRPPYTINPFFPVIGRYLTLTPVLPNLRAPIMPGSRCAFRLYMEMFPFLLDRPEYAKLNPLPSEQDLLLAVFNVPRQEERFWAVQSKCPKYDQLYFATTKKNITCFLCLRVFTSIPAFANSCLGSIHTVQDVHDATQVIMTIEMGKIVVRTLNAEKFLSYWDSLNNPPKPKVQPKILSALYTISFEPLNPASVIKYVTTLFASFKPALIVYNIETNTEQLAIRAFLWLSVPLHGKDIPGLIHHADLDKFHSLLFQGLYRSILKSKPIQTHNALIYYWRESFQASKCLSTSKSAAQ